MPRLSATVDIRPLNVVEHENIKLADDVIHYTFMGTIAVLSIALLYLLIKRRSKI